MAGHGPQPGPRRNWRSDIVDLEFKLEKSQGQLKEARTLARIMFRILQQMPTDPSEYDLRLAIDNVPSWLLIQPRVRKND